MKSAFTPFNSFLLCVAMAGAACMTPDDPLVSKTAKAPSPTPPKKGRGKEAALVRIYVETMEVDPARTQPVSVYRDNPITVNLDKLPVLNEAHIAAAEVLQSDEGLALKLILNTQGAWLLDSLSVSQKGKRIGIAARWKEGRWLGAPRLNRRISDGVIVFVPDATPEELDWIVKGVNNLANKNK